MSTQKTWFFLFVFCFLGIHMQKSKFVPHTLCDLKRRTYCFNLPGLLCSCHNLSKLPSWRQIEEIYPSVSFLNGNLLWVMNHWVDNLYKHWWHSFSYWLQKRAADAQVAAVYSWRGWAFSHSTEHTRGTYPGVFLWGLHLGQVTKIKSPWEHELHHVWNTFSLFLRDPFDWIS